MTQFIFHTSYLLELLIESTRLIWLVLFHLVICAHFPSTLCLGLLMFEEELRGNGSIFTFPSWPIIFNAVIGWYKEATQIAKMMGFLSHLCFLRYHTFFLHLKEVLVQVPSVWPLGLSSRHNTLILHFLRVSMNSLHCGSTGTLLMGVARNSGLRYHVSPHEMPLVPLEPP